MKTGLISFDKDRQDKTGSARIRVYNLITHCNDFEEFKAGVKYDAVIFQKYYWWEYAALYDGIKVLDICDPDWLSGSESAPLMKMLTLIDGVVANTEETADYIRKLTKKPVIVIQDRHDMSLFKEKKIHKGKAKSVVWFGYSHNAHILKDYIFKLMEHNLRLTIMAEKYVTAVSGQTIDYRDKETFINWPSTIEAVNKELIRHDFALLPGRRRPQDQYKSNNKDTHAWAVGLPVAKWGDDIDRLIDEAARIKDQEEHYELIKKQYDCKLSVKQWQDFLKELWKKKSGL